MREIKFRAWDKRGKMMVPHGRLFRLDTSNEYPFLPLLENMYSNSIYPFDVEIMQYTGLKDKNGKEIYEGDIYKNNKSIGVIVYEDDSFIIDWKVDLDFWNEHLKRHLVKGEVIGNIYENPELLEV